ncbi:MAG: hypothetical protein JSS32_03440 [Verrucomicrobia bacterium]|nr:hypothetical protein [Verrucomicrobiota bacterium]
MQVNPNFSAAEWKAAINGVNQQMEDDKKFHEKEEQQRQEIANDSQK